MLNVKFVDILKPIGREWKKVNDKVLYYLKHNEES